MHYGSFTTYAKQAEDKGHKDLAKRIRAEGRMAAALVDTALERGYTVSVHDGGEWALKKSSDKAAIMGALFSTDQDTVRLRDADGAVVGNFDLVYGNSGSELIADHSDNDACNAIWSEVIQPLADKLDGEG